jgi:sulfur carrier protein
MTIKLVLRKKEFQLEGKSIQVKQALQQLSLSPEAHLLVRGGDLLNENDWLKDGDEVKVVPVISGGSGQAARLPANSQRGEKRLGTWR